jgi:membrane protein YdbS with pleckstrin-like domain
MNSGMFRPDPKLKTKYNVYVWLVFVTCFLPFALLALIPEAGWTYLVIFAAANALWLLVAFLLIPPYYRSIEYELGEEEVITRRGILTKRTDTIPYRTITNISVQRGPLDRWLSMGSIAIHTAGFSGQTQAEAKLSGLADCQRVQAALLAALRRYRTGTGVAVGAEEALAPGQETAALLRQIRDDLRAWRQSAEAQTRRN